MPDIKEFEEGLVKVLSALKPYLRHFVLVGGWVPYLYSKYLWKGTRLLPVSTLDIDLGVKEISPPWKNKTLFSKFKQLRYELEPVYNKEPFPSIPIFTDQKGRFKMRIEFITSFYVSDDTANKFLGKEIAIHRIDGFELLLTDIIELKIPYKSQVIKVNIPEPYIFVFHKGLTFPTRDDETKQAKDLYYLYYVLRFHPRYGDLITELKSLERNEYFGAFIQNLKEFFNSEVSEGPLKIESISSADPFVPSIRKDAYLRIQKFIRDLQSSNADAMRQNSTL